MRTIKFRAWLPEIKEMGNVVTLKASNEGYEFHTITAEIFYPLTKRQAFYTIENFILMQYVGLKDKNGTEIYEGDIIQVDNDDSVDMWCRGEKGIIEWTLCKFSFVFMGGQERKTLNDDFEDCVIVIGDIYRNPELLKR